MPVEKNEIVHTEILAEISKRKAMPSSEHLWCFLSPLSSSVPLTNQNVSMLLLALTLSLRQCTPNLGRADSSVLILINQMLVDFQLL